MPDLFFTGGLNQRGDFQIDPTECSAGRNFRLEQDSLEFMPRQPQDLLETATNAGEITGILQLIKRDDTQTQIVVAGSVAYTWDLATAPTTTASSVVASKLRDCYWSLDDFLIITDLQQNNTVKTWDGSTWGTLTHGISGVTDLYAKYCAVHQGRVVLGAIKTDSTDLPHVLLFSEFEDAEVYDSAAASQGESQAPVNTFTGNEAFWLVSPDLRPINGMLEYFDTLIISTVDGKLFRLVGLDAATYDWEEFYPRSAALGTESITSIGTDIVYMKAGGGIDLLSSTERFGDVTQDDLSRFILDETSGVSDSQVVYDQANQQVLFFIANKVLVLDKTRLSGAVSPWTVYVTAMSNGFNTKAARYLRWSDDTYKVVWGDDSGNLYDFRGTGTDGDGGDTPIATFRKTSRVRELDTNNQPLYGRVEYKRLDEVTVDATIEWSENYATTRSSIPLKGAIITANAPVFNGAYYFGGGSHFNEGSIQTNPISFKGFSPVGRSPGFTLRLDINSTGDFRINRISFE